MKKFAILFSFLIITCTVQAQDLLAGLDNGPKQKDYTIATFKGTRLINLHTIETLSKGSLEVRIAHRFGNASGGIQNFWGLDASATIQLRMDYALTDRLLVGIGRANEKKTVDGFLKYRLLRQTTNGSMPVSVTAIGSTNVATVKNSLSEDYRYHLPTSRLSYMASLIIARKFNSNLSLQISPIYTHFNIVDKLTDKNDLLSVAGSFRYKFSKRAAFTAEYIARVTRYTVDPRQYQNVLGIGFDIETGGHVFQIFMTNGYSVNEARTVAYTLSSGNSLRLGFNISRVFSVRKND